MGIFGQLPQGQTGRVLCESRAVTEQKARFVGCNDLPRVNKDCRAHLLIGCDLRLFRVSECGDVEFVTCVANLQTWVCEDCCPQDYAEVKAVWDESLAAPEGGFARLPDGRVVKVNLSTLVVTEIACEPTTHQECITCITTSKTAVTDAVNLHPHKPFVSPSDYSVTIVPAAC